MHARHATAAVLAALVALGAACAGGPPVGGLEHGIPTGRATGQPSPFPSREALQKLAETPAPLALPAGAERVSVDSWTLEGPFPARLGGEPIADPTPWERLLVEEAGPEANASDAMRCAAHELARFLIAHEAPPTESLTEFMLARCGETGRHFREAHLVSPVPPDADDARVLEVFREPVSALIAKTLGLGRPDVGIWAGRHAGFGVVVVVSAEPAVRVDPVGTRPDPDGRLRLRGELLVPAQSLSAYVNQGSTGFAVCGVPSGLLLPRFAVECPTERGDETAWVSLLARPPGRVLAQNVLSVLARPSGRSGRRYRRASYGPPLAVADPAGFAAALLERVNQLRARRGASPLVLDRGQSAVAQGLAPQYVRANVEADDPSLADAIGLGLLAGWDVDGAVRGASFGGALSFGSTDVDQWMGEALAQPGLRATLLDGAWSRLAVGAVVDPQAKALAGLVATYATVDPSGVDAERQVLYERVRRAVGRPLAVDPEAEKLATGMAQRVARGELSADDATAALLRQVGESRPGTRLSAWWIEAPSAFDAVLPPDLARSLARQVGVGAVYYRPAGEPWVRVLALVVAE